MFPLLEHQKDLSFYFYRPYPWDENCSFLCRDNNNNLVLKLLILSRYWGFENNNSNKTGGNCLETVHKNHGIFVAAHNIFREDNFHLDKCQRAGASVSSLLLAPLRAAIWQAKWWFISAIIRCNSIEMVMWHWHCIVKGFSFYSSKYIALCWH